MNNLQNFIKNFAVRNWKLYSFKKEWLSVILLIIILKIATSAVSIFSGFFYLDNFYFSFLNSDNASKIFSILTLLLIEGLNALFLAKFFKFALRVQFKTAAFPLLCAVLTFTISFVISCNGIALYSAKGEDLSKEINSKYNTIIAETKKENSANIAQLESYINTIKANPENWSGGKRCILSEYQNKEIAKTFDLITSYKVELNKTLQNIEKQRNNELIENNKKTVDTADKFYNIVAFIMLIQIICSGGLWFFWCKISAQDAPENEYAESINDIYNKANNLIDNGLTACINQKFSLITTAFQQLESDYNMKETTASEAQKKDTEKRKKNVGFDVENVNNETQKNAYTGGVSGVENVVLTPSDNVLSVRVCEECGTVLKPSQIARNARFCCASCRVKNYNKKHDKKISLKSENLKH